MRSSTTAAALVALSSTATLVSCSIPVFHPSHIQAPFLEQFTPDWTSRWTVSQATKQSPVGDEQEVMSYVGKWNVEEPSIVKGIEGDEGLVMKTKAAHHAISALFPSSVSTLVDPSHPSGSNRVPLVVQYEVKLQKGLECGGAYVKLLTAGEEGALEEGADYTDKTPFTVMFGPVSVPTRAQGTGSTTSQPDRMV